MENTVFAYIEEKLVKEKLHHVSFHTWGSDEIRKMYRYLTDTITIHPVMRYNNRTYMVTEQSARNGCGGMDQGSPHTIKFELLPDPVEVLDEIPIPLEQIDVQSIVDFAKSVTKEVVEDGRGNEENDHWAFETIMKAVYGKDYFHWYNKNT